MPASFVSSAQAPWKTLPEHRDWLKQQTNGLFDLYSQHALNPAGGFHEFDPQGAPFKTANPVRPIHLTARMVHCFVIASLLGRPGSDEMIDHGMNYLWSRHRDQKFGGYFWSLDNEGAKDASKQGYGHAFVLLAASSALLVGHPLARPMLDDVTEILESRYWLPEHGTITEEFERDWSPMGGNYRGQNCNMHLTEALMAAFEATGERIYLDKAEKIADLIIRRRAGENGFRVAEHFDENWAVDRDYKAVNEMFRPSGTTPGHAMEWARLILQLWELGGRKHAWMPDAARQLFSRAVALGWDENHGGLFYTLDWSDRPAMRFKLWWPMAEAAGAAAFLIDHAPDDYHEEWYRRVWNHIARNHVDPKSGGWQEELTEDLRPAFSMFPGKADIYHALQACLIPLYPSTGSLTKMIREANRA